MSLYINGKQLATIDDLYSMLGITNLLTDEEMNIANTIKSPAAQKAISNVSYSNGINSFHYCGVADYERFNWKLKVTPNTNYKMLISANSTAQMNYLNPYTPYLPWGINSTQDILSADNSDMANWRMPAPWIGTEQGELRFNSQNHSEVYLVANFGYLVDGTNTDIQLKIEMLKADSLQDQINALKSKVGGSAIR